MPGGQGGAQLVPDGGVDHLQPVTLGVMRSIGFKVNVTTMRQAAGEEWVLLTRAGSQGWSQVWRGVVSVRGSHSSTSA